MAPGTQINITETVTLPHSLRLKHKLKSWLCEQQLKVFRSYHGLLLSFWSVDSLFWGPAAAKTAQLKDYWSTSELWFTLKCLLVAVLRSCCWTGERSRGFVSLLLRFIGRTALFPVDSSLFVLLLDWPAASRQFDMPFLNADYQHIFPSLSEPGCNVLNLWRCAVNLSVKKNPLMLWSSLTFLSTLWEFWSCLWKPARSHLVSTGLPRLWWVIWTLGFCSSLMQRTLSLSEFFLYCGRCVLLRDFCLAHVSMVHAGNLGGSSNL